MRFRFSENNTAIKLLEQPNPRILLLPGSEFDTTELERDISENKHLFLANIDVIEPTFYEAFSRTVKELNEGIPDSIFENVCGTFILQDLPETAVNTYFYKFSGKIQDDSFYVKASVYGFIELPGMSKSFLRVAYCNTGEKKLMFIEDDGIKQLPEYYQQTPIDVMYIVFMMYMFKIHCHIDVKEMNPVSRFKEGKNEYSNISKYKMNYLNAAWFTELVSSGPFWVGRKKGGFWRNVPVGPGRQERSKKFILPFMKTGYKRKAGATKFRENLDNNHSTDNGNIE